MVDWTALCACAIILDICAPLFYFILFFGQRNGLASPFFQRDSAWNEAIYPLKAILARPNKDDRVDERERRGDVQDPDQRNPRNFAQ